MEIPLYDPNNPLTPEKLDAILENIMSNNREVKTDYSGAVNLFVSISDEIELKKHDTHRLLIFQSQSLTAIKALSFLLIDHISEFKDEEITQIKNLKAKFELQLDDIRGRIELYIHNDQTVVSNNNTVDDKQVFSLDIGMSLNTISDNLKKKFPTLNIDQYNEAYFIVDNEILNDPLIYNMTYSNFESAFLKEIYDDPDRKYFLKIEIKAVTEFLTQALVNIKNKSRIIKELNYLIIKDKKQSIRTYFLKYALEGNYQAFVSMFFSYDLIKYLRFLRGDMVTQIINESKLIQKETTVQMTNDNFNMFIDEVYNLEIKTVERYIIGDLTSIFTTQDNPNLPHPKAMFLSLEHYNQHESNYEFNIKKIQQKAITDLIKLTPEQISIQLKRLVQWANRFKKFWKWYSEIYIAFNKNELRFIDFYLKLESFFNVPKYKEAVITQDFLHDLHDAAMFKHGYLSGLISQVKPLLEKSDDDKSLRLNEKSQNISEIKYNEVIFNTTENGTKLKDYVPLYGNLYNPNERLEEDFEFKVEDKTYTINTLFGQPETIISPAVLAYLKKFNRDTFRVTINGCHTVENVSIYMRKMLDIYISGGGDPQHWIAHTLFDIEENSNYYPKAYLDHIQKNLYKWGEYYGKTSQKVGFNPTSQNGISIKDTSQLSLVSENEEPVNMVKAWVVYFEKNKTDKSVLSAVNRISDEHNWSGSKNTIKTKFEEINRITNKKTTITEKQKSDLFIAIPYLSVQNQIKAKLFYSKLK